MWLYLHISDEFERLSFSYEFWRVQKSANSRNEHYTFDHISEYGRGNYILRMLALYLADYLKTFHIHPYTFVSLDLIRGVRKSMVTHEDFIGTVRALSVARIPNQAMRERLLSAKLTYGSGTVGHRGICFYDAWKHNSKVEFIEICALGEESEVQLAGTTIHELAHCLAGGPAGHGSAWKAAAKSLGLVHALAAGQKYSPADFDPALWTKLAVLPVPTDGRPVFAYQLPIIP